MLLISVIVSRFAHNIILICFSISAKHKGNTIAIQKQLVVTGFAGLLILAVKQSVLTPTEAQQLLDQAISNRFRLSNKLYQQISAYFKQQDS